ncbi:MAG: hypothetical protein Q8K99_04900 [Actinomycetota bacterium]|nr:hypothetical protein [Actinomycetota bacterium]
MSKFVYRPDLGRTTPNPGPATHYRPQLDILLSGPAQAVMVTAIVDSGADLCTFKAELAATVGLDLQSGSKINVDGVTGDGTGWLHPVRLVVDSVTFDADALFIAGDTAACLGRIPLFCLQKVAFCQKGANPALWWFELSSY